LLRRRAGDRFSACSAGTEPAEVHPMARRVLDEIGVDTSGLAAKPLSAMLGRVTPRYAIIVCAQAAESCPRLYPFAANVLHWPFDDPARIEGAEDLQLAAFRRTRDEIDARLREWLSSN
jgi:arsenate reductase